MTIKHKTLYKYGELNVSVGLRTKYFRTKIDKPAYAEMVSVHKHKPLDSRRQGTHL